MNGFTRTFFAIAGVVLGLLSRVCIWPGERLKGWAAWCKERSVAPSTSRGTP